MFVKKILIVGGPGVGKTTLAKVMSLQENLPHIEVDRLYWKNKKGGDVREDFVPQLKALLSGDGWIVEGHYGKIKSQLPKPDLILIVRPGTIRRIFRLLRRDLVEFAKGERRTSDLVWLLRNYPSLPTFDEAALAVEWQTTVRTVRN